MGDTKRVLLKEGLSLVILFLVVGCTAPADPVPVSTDALRGVERIAMLPVIFHEGAQDRYYQHRAGGEIRWHLRRDLQHKGYTVELLEKEDGFPATYHPDVSRPAEFVSRAPADADALLVIRVDDFLEEGRMGEGSQYLEIYATAWLVKNPDGEVIWQNSGFGEAHGSYISDVSLTMELFTVPAELAEDLLETLPEARP